MLEGGSAAPWQIRRYREDSGRKEAIQGQLTRHIIYLNYHELPIVDVQVDEFCRCVVNMIIACRCTHVLCLKFDEVCIYQSCSSNQFHNVRFAAETIDGPMAVGCEACSCEIWHQLVV